MGQGSGTAADSSSELTHCALCCNHARSIRDDDDVRHTAVEDSGVVPFELGAVSVLAPSTPSTAVEALAGTPERYRADKFVVLLAASLDGDIALRQASEDLRADRDVVLAAVLQNGCALRHTSDALCADREIVKAAITQDGHALQSAATVLRGDREIVLAAVKQDGDALRHAAKPCRCDREIVLAAVGSRGQSVQWAADILRSDRDILLLACAQDGMALRYASESIRGHRDVVMTAVAQAGPALQYAWDRFRANREVVKAAVAQDGSALEFAGERLRADREVVLHAYVHHGRSALKWTTEGIARELASIRITTAAAMLEVAQELELPDVEEHDFMFMVVVSKGEDAKVGLEVKIEGAGSPWQVRRIDEGPIHEWNTDHSGSILEVVRGDYIVEVNGISGNSAAMRSKMIVGGTLAIKVHRKAAKQAAVSPKTPHRQCLDSFFNTESQKSTGNEGRCVICLDNVARVTFVHGNTGHLASCLRCAASLPASGDECPICRQIYSKRIHTYIV